MWEAEFLSSSKYMEKNQVFGNIFNGSPPGPFFQITEAPQAVPKAFSMLLLLSERIFQDISGQDMRH